MRQAVAAVFAVVLALGACSSPAPVGGTLPGPVPTGVSFPDPPESAPEAPEFDLELLDGRVVDATEHWDDRPVVLVFFEPWCTLCREQQSGINELADEYRDIVLFLGIAGQAEPDEIEDYVAETGITYPVGTDPDGTRWLKYAVAEPPLVALISKDGRLLRGWPGGVAGDDLRGHIEELAVDSG